MSSQLRLSMVIPGEDTTFRLKTLCSPLLFHLTFPSRATAYKANKVTVFLLFSPPFPGSFALKSKNSDITHHSRFFSLLMTTEKKWYDSWAADSHERQDDDWFILAFGVCFSLFLDSSLSNSKCLRGEVRAHSLHPQRVGLSRNKRWPPEEHLADTAWKGRARDDEGIYLEFWKPFFNDASLWTQHLHQRPPLLGCLVDRKGTVVREEMIGAGNRRSEQRESRKAPIHFPGKQDKLLNVVMLLDGKVK